MGKAAKAPKAAPEKAQAEKADSKEPHQLGLTVKKDENFAEWYTQVIVRSEMIEYYDISGCYILRPHSYFLWEQERAFFDKEIKKLGVKNAYFPLFVSKTALETEKDHVEGFAPEVAWVTRSGKSELEVPIAIRPTSETIMYPAYAKWIRSHRDLPIKLNQWTGVVRWEFKQPTPFIRTREFLWQEGHTAHATHEEAQDMVYKILDLYERVYNELLACPVVKGVKSEGEKFAGGFMTTTVEAFVPANGRAIQGATSHHLGTNFAKMFNIEFEDEHGKKAMPSQTSWGLTTRSIGVMVMNHGDDKGLVLPPRIAPEQVIIIPIPYGKDKGGSEGSWAEQVKRCDALQETLRSSSCFSSSIRVRVDDRENYTPGWKYNHWEMKGIPIRLELGPKDMEKEQCRLVRRDTGAKEDVSWKELGARVSALLEIIQREMLERAQAKMDSSITKVSKWDEVMPALNKKHLVLAPWCEEEETEDEMKKLTKAAALEAEVMVAGEEGGEPALTGAMKPLCIPLVQDPLPKGAKCFFTGKPAKRWCLFGRSY